MESYMINISTLMFLLVSAHNGDCFIAQFLDSVPGEIQCGNFSYFSVQQPGILSLELISHIGDCDLYVSQFNTKPTFELDSYCLESSSCGLDKIIIPESFKRPLSIGVYGHPSHEVSTYTLNIYQIKETDAENGLDEVTKNMEFDGYVEESKSQNTSYFYNFISLIWSLFKNIWHFLVSIDESNASHPLFFLLDLFF